MSNIFGSMPPRPPRKEGFAALHGTQSHTIYVQPLTLNINKSSVYRCYISSTEVVQGLFHILRHMQWAAGGKYEQTIFTTFCHPLPEGEILVHECMSLLSNQENL